MSYVCQAGPCNNPTSGNTDYCSTHAWWDDDNEE